MKPFSVASMTNMRGVCYPTGPMVLMSHGRGRAARVPRDLPISHGQRYRHLVIEDLVDRG